MTTECGDPDPCSPPTVPADQHHRRELAGCPCRATRKPRIGHQDSTRGSDNPLRRRSNASWRRVAGRRPRYRKHRLRRRAAGRFACHPERGPVPDSLRVRSEAVPFCRMNPAIGASADRPRRLRQLSGRPECRGPRAPGRSQIDWHRCRIDRLRRPERAPVCPAFPALSSQTEPRTWSP